MGPKFGGRLLVSLGLGLLVYLGMSLYADVRELWANLAGFAWRLAPVVLLLSLGNYLLRFVKWSLYLRVLGVQVATGPSLLIFLAGLVMSVTPGKVGELLKAFLLRGHAGVPVARTAPVILAERLTDFLALFMLSLLGIFTYEANVALVLVGLGVIVAALGVVASKRLSLGLIGLVARLPRLGRVAAGLEEAYLSLRAMTHPRVLVTATGLSAVAWLMECLGFHLVLTGFQGVSPSVRLSTFIYSVATLAGAPSPGGLGITEGGMVGLTQALVQGMTRQTAVAATLLIRVATLWFAVGVGLASLALFKRLVLQPSAAEVPAAQEAPSGQEASQNPLQQISPGSQP